MIDCSPFFHTDPGTRSTGPRSEANHTTGTGTGQNGPLAEPNVQFAELMAGSQDVDASIALGVPLCLAPGRGLLGCARRDRGLGADRPREPARAWAWHANEQIERIEKPSDCVEGAAVEVNMDPQIG